MKEYCCHILDDGTLCSRIATRGHYCYAHVPNNPTVDEILDEILSRM